MKADLPKSGLAKPAAPGPVLGDVPEFISGGVYLDWAKKYLASKGGLSELEEDVLRRYAGADYAYMNQILRNDTERLADLPADYQARAAADVETLKGVIDRVRTQQATTVYRGLKQSSNTAKRLQAAFDSGDLRVGDTIAQKGFASTSVTKMGAQAFHKEDGVRMVIDLPMGTPAVPLGRYGLPDETELLIQAGQDYVVRGVSRDDKGLLTIRVGLVNEGSIKNTGREAKFPTLAGKSAPSKVAPAKAPVVDVTDDVFERGDIAPKEFAPYARPRNEAIAPGQRANTGPFAKTQVADKSVRSDVALLSPQVREQFFNDLSEFMDGLRDEGNNVLGRYTDLQNGGTITKLEDGQEVTRKVTASEYWSHIREQKKERTVADLLAFAQQWGKQQNLPEELANELGARLGESLTYVPGSKEFAMGVTRLRKGTDAWGELADYLGPAMSNVEGASLQNVRDRVLDPVYYDLYGKVDDFAVRAAGQGVRMAETTTRSALFKEMREAGVIQENPFPGAVLIRAQEGLTPEEVSKYGMQDWVNGDWWINPGNLAAMKNAFASTRLGGPIERALQPFSNLFRRSALLTDISSHVTQMLGNLAMMKHMGYGPLFDNPKQMASGFRRSFDSILLMDDHYKDMVESGLQISMTQLSTAQRTILAERILLRNDTRNAGLKDELEYLHSTFQNVLNAAEERGIGLVQRGEDLATQGLQAQLKRLEARRPGANEGGVQASDYVTNRQKVTAMKPGHVMAMHDMLTRAYTWDQVVRTGTQELVDANPWLLAVDGLQGKNGLLDSARLRELTSDSAAWDALKAATPSLKNVDLDEVQSVADQLVSLKRSAAEIGNEVALNYFEVPRMVRLLTQTGVVPFMKFQWKAVGRFAEWVEERPWQFAPYYRASLNGNTAFSENPDQYLQTQESMPQNVRNALTVPTGTKDSLGRPEYVDLSRWVPFGMFAASAGGSVNVDGTAAPNQIISAPLIELAMAAVTGEDADGQPIVKPGQSKLAAIAERMALMFSPSGVGPGGRRAQQLANAIEQSKFVLDENGSPVYVNPLLNAGAWWGRLPQNIGQELGQAFGDTGSVTGMKKLPDVPQPWTTPEQAFLRGIIPGATYSPNTTKAYAQINAAFDRRIQEKEREISSIVGTADYQYAPGKYQSLLEKRQAELGSLQQAKHERLQRLVLGE